MFSGVHFVLYSRTPDADRRFMDEVLGWRSVDAGHGWLIFALPPAEMAVHPASENFSLPSPEGEMLGGVVYLMCRDLAATIDLLATHGVETSPVERAGWGVRTTIPLPGGGRLGLYQPAHPTAVDIASDT